MMSQKGEAATGLKAFLSGKRELDWDCMNLAKAKL